MEMFTEQGSCVLMYVGSLWQSPICPQLTSNIQYSGMRKFGHPSQNFWYCMNSKVERDSSPKGLHLKIKDCFQHFTHV